MHTIEKIKLHNFKRFSDFEVELNPSRNIFIGENESGKSSILTAINLVLSGSRSQVESQGIDQLLNISSVSNFLQVEKEYAALPSAYVELYLSAELNQELAGMNNSDRSNCNGLRMELCPNHELGAEISEILNTEDDNFPYEYYQVRFATFSGEAYTGYKRYLKHILLDTSLVGGYATKEYVVDMYDAYLHGAEAQKHQNEYRQHKQNFTDNVLAEINGRIPNYQFGIRSDKKSNLLTDLILTEDNVDIENKGKGRQCFIKAEFALMKAEETGRKIDVALIEEPENHLSHINMNRLIQKIDDADDKQLIIATHSNLISARLDLRNTILLHRSSELPLPMPELPEDTARFFIKAPDHGVLDFILSHRVILVEGDAEFILMELLYQHVTGAELADSEVQVISVDGTSFKRYLDIAKKLNIRVAVVRDNDGNYEKNCVRRYDEYVSDTISVFADPDPERYTFEKCIYEDNKDLCDELFLPGRVSLTVEQYMLDNKTDVALALLENEAGRLIVPGYIEEAVRWISE